MTLTRRGKLTAALLVVTTLGAFAAAWHWTAKLTNLPRRSGRTPH